MGAAAITIDVDSLRLYSAIHGRDDNAGSQDPTFDPIYETAMPRFFELLEDVGARATLFLIGEDAVQHPRAFAQIGASEIASHSYRHDYRFSQWSLEAIEEDLQRAESALASFTDQPIVGFRAPGYNVSPNLLRALERRGYVYDSSLLPAPLYWSARAAAIARYAVAGRRSASMVGQLRQFAGPLVPYRMRPEFPWRKSSEGLIEMPMAVHPWTRLPLIGTSWVLFPDRVRRWLLDTALAALPTFVFEMHAIDLLDASDRGIPPALAHAQPDLRVPYMTKRTAFRSLFRRLADDCGISTLRTIAESY